MKQTKRITHHLKRRFLSLLLSCLLLVPVLPQEAKAAGFSDVPPGAWYAPYVLELTEKNIISGTTPTTFSPKGYLTRGAFANILAKTVLTKQELSAFDFRGSFKDVAPSKWYNSAVNWCAENGVVSGYENGTFQPNRRITRQELAKMVTNFANAVGRKLTPSLPSASFTDSGKIASWAKDSVALCQRCEIINGYKDGSFRPKGLATRAEAAALFSRFLSSSRVSDDYKITRKRLNGVSYCSLEFDPALYQADVLMGNDLVDGRESATSMVSRSSAKIAVDAAFFDMSSYMPYSTIIKHGRVLTVDNGHAPDRPSFTMDALGNFSIESFALRYTATRYGQDGSVSTVQEVGFNRWPVTNTDGTRIVFTRDWGRDLAFPAWCALQVDEAGQITAKYENKKGSEIPIPELSKGYVLAQRAKRQEEGSFFTGSEVGDFVELSHTYEGLDSGTPELSIGAGPRLVKAGKAYGDLSTYQKEGFTDPNITTYSARRVSIGIKKDGSLMIVSAYCTLGELSSLLVSLGCQDAMNLDGGGSSTLYVDGFWLLGVPSRALNNLLIFR